MPKPKARLLTYDEILSMRPGKWIWVEIKNHPDGYFNGLYHLQLNRCILRYHMDDSDIECFTIGVRGIKQTIVLDTYDGGWRVWSDKPTRDDMRYTEWDYSTWLSRHRCVDCIFYDEDAKYCSNEFEPHDLSDVDVKEYRLCGNFVASMYRCIDCKHCEGIGLNRACLRDNDGIYAIDPIGLFQYDTCKFFEPFNNNKTVME